MTKFQQTDKLKTKLKVKQKTKFKIKPKIKLKTMKSAKLVLTIIFVVLTALFSFGRVLNSYLPEWIYIPSWQQIFDIAGLHLEEYTEVPDAPLIVAFVDVGQGDCTFIKTEEADILIDAGESESAESVFEILNLYNVDDLEYIIVTHPHCDHVGALPEIMNEIEVKELILPAKSEKTTDGVEYRNELIQIAHEKNIKVTELPLLKAHRDELMLENYDDYDFVLGKLCFEFTGPIVDDDNLNNTSIIVKLTFGKTSFLFTGDAEKLEEYTLLSRDFEEGGGTLKSDILKVAHHGSKSSSTDDFIEAVDPEYAIISCGADNEYGHPHSEVLQRLESSGCSIWNTAVCGDIIFAVNESDYLSANDKRNKITVWTENT